MENTSKFIKNVLFGLILFTSATVITAMAEQPSATPAPTASATEATPPGNTATPAAAPTAPTPNFCPPVKELIKKNLRWYAGINWKGNDDSFVNEIGSFVGAQWVGIKYGTIICLYQGKDNIDFPVSLQQIHSALILEPSAPSWSGLVENRKMCQSGNVYDCPFFIKPQESATDIYKQIEYIGGPPQSGILNEPQY